MSLFAHPETIDPKQLDYVPYRLTHKVKSFSCGDSDLDFFLTSDEVNEYQKRGLGRTKLIYYQGDLVAYVTTSMDSLRIEYLKTYKKLSKLSEMQITAIPAIKIGRLAVSKDHQNLGIGRTVVSDVTADAIGVQNLAAIRLIIVEAKPDARAFYEKLGFVLTYPVKRERNKRHRTMFLDLAPLTDLIEE